MAWTVERVELLRQLVLDGKSAGKIAKIFNCDLSRNAVIGKIHRLGLPGRVKRSVSAAIRSDLGRAPRSTDAPDRALPSIRRTEAEWIAAGFTAEDRTEALAAEDKSALPELRCATGGGHSLSPADKGLREEIQAPKPLRADPLLGRLLNPSLPPKEPDIVEDIVVPMSLRVTIGELKDSMCKWPLGDPSDFKSFRYCGSPAPGDAPYCVHHARISYQVPQDRKRGDKRLLVLPRF